MLDCLGNEINRTDNLKVSYRGKQCWATIYIVSDDGENMMLQGRQSPFTSRKLFSAKEVAESVVNMSALGHEMPVEEEVEEEEEDEASEMFPV